MARHVESYEPPIPDPDEEEKTNAQKTLYTKLNIILSTIDKGQNRSGIR